MRRVFLSLAVVALLLLSQQGALWHELSHLAELSAPQSSGDHHPPGQDACVTCLAFASIGGAAAQSVPAIALPPATLSIAAAAPPAFVDAEPPTQRSRGPPRWS